MRGRRGYAARMADDPHDLDTLRDRLRDFARERAWEPFHSPKNLAMALSVEAAELLEHFQWLTEAESRRLAPDRLEAVGEECADVLLYLVQLADQLGIDLLDAARRKMARNAARYPADAARGHARKAGA
jgi:NTP pyrophosphatase (non-canonical NTP hydrolase)